MRVWVNDIPVIVFEGACVEDAVNKYASRLFRVIPKPFPEVKDGHGNQVMPDGSLSGDDRLYVGIGSGR